MVDVFDGVRAHYSATGLLGRLRTALTEFGPENEPLLARHLSALDQFHTRGLAATVELARLAGITDRASVLDVGSGLGGPARLLAANYGCRVTGIDISESFTQAARYLTERTGQSEEVTFQTANALALPFQDAAFDVVVLQHVAMNIGDRGRLYREIHRVLKPGGRFAVNDVVSIDGAPHYPVPWGATPGVSHLLTRDATREAIEQAGFRALSLIDDTEVAKTWMGALRPSEPSLAPNLSLVMGPSFAEALHNLGRNLMEGRVGVLTAVFEAGTART